MSEALTAGRGARQRLLDLVGTQLTLHALDGGELPRVGERWAIEAILGSGGFGVVFRARNLRLQRTVALKLYALDADDAEVRSAIREARSLARLDHPAIVAVHAVDEDDLIADEQRVPCALVEMQLVDGETLPQWLRSTRREPAAVFGVLIGAGRALGYAHAQGLVHRDFKPDNVMIDRGGQPRVIDFGLALVAHSSPREDAVPWSSRADAIGTRDTMTGALRGTPGYMAPELSERRPSAASDQFAFAVVLEEILSGRYPLAGATAHAARVRDSVVALSPRLRPLLARAMARDPADRFPTMEALCDALERELRRAASASVTGAWLTRRARTGLLLGLGIIGVGVGIAVALTWVPRSDDRDNAPIVDAPRASEPETAREVCPDLTRFDGQWRTTVRVVWSESSRHELPRHYVLGLVARADCSFAVAAERLSDPFDDPAMSPTFSTTTRASVTREPNGTWVASMRLTFAGDARLYGVREHDEFLLGLGNGNEREPELAGAYRRTDDAGLRLRSGWVVAGFEASPSAHQLDAVRPPCAARCWIECAGADAEAACRARSCAQFGDDPDDLCGPSDAEFTAPLQASVTLGMLRDDTSWVSDATDLRELCETHGTRLIGAWGVWRGTGRDAQLYSLEVAAAGCSLRGEVRGPDGHAIAVVGEVSAQRSWTIRAATEDPRLPNAWVLVGDGPAFGLDAGMPGAKLRAYVRKP